MTTLTSDYKFTAPFPAAKNAAEYILRKLSTLPDSGKGQTITNTLNGETIDYDRIKKLSLRVKNAFIEKGLKKGDTIVYSSHDGAKLHIFLLGIWRAHGIARSTYPEDLGEDLIQLILESKAKWILCDEGTATENLKAASNIPWKVEVIVSEIASGCTSMLDFFSEKYDALSYNTLETLLDLDSKESKSSDIALILPTSGTTGRSKGAIYTHENLINNISIFEKFPFVTSQHAPFLLTSRLTHFTGTVIPLGFFSAGRSILINPKPCEECLRNDVENYKVKSIYTFPKYISYLLNAKNTSSTSNSLEYAFTGGQAIDQSLMSLASSQKFDLFEVYGMTETGLLATNTNCWSSLPEKTSSKIEVPLRSCGKLAPGNKLQVRDIETGDLLRAGETGEFYFESPFKCNGYFKREEANKETFIGEWIRTGDVGFYDENGYIFITDRAKDIFKYFNNHICPSELETLLLTHPNVLQACVVGIPDPNGGDTIPRAFVVLKQAEAGSSKEVKEQDIHKFVNDKVAYYKHLRGGVLFIDEIPLGKTGKFDRKALLRIIPMP